MARSQYHNSLVTLIIKFRSHYTWLMEQRRPSREGGGGGGRGGIQGVGVLFCFWRFWVRFHQIIAFIDSAARKSCLKIFCCKYQNKIYNLAACRYIFKVVLFYLHTQHILLTSVLTSETYLVLAKISRRDRSQTDR